MAGSLKRYELKRWIHLMSVASCDVWETRTVLESCAWETLTCVSRLSSSHEAVCLDEALTLA